LEWWWLSQLLRHLPILPQGGEGRGYTGIPVSDKLYHG
jgi:hypothetical protein